MALPYGMTRILQWRVASRCNRGFRQALACHELVAVGLKTLFDFSPVGIGQGFDFLFEKLHLRLPRTQTEEINESPEPSHLLFHFKPFRFPQLWN
jgi:hypothetical protein